MLGQFRYEAVLGWEQLPSEYQHLDVDGVDVDSADRVYAITRYEPRVIVYERDGTFVRSWGEGFFAPRTHGITIAPDGSVYCVNEGDHTISKFTPEGKLLVTLGTSGVPGDTGYDGASLASIKRGGPPFNRPTNLAVSPSGDLYVSDGYGNARLHRFSPEGRLIHSWGEPGTRPGQFNLPHGVEVAPDGRVLVADRENDRIQVFDADGAYLAEWTDTQRPTDICIGRDGLVYVAELAWLAGQQSLTRGRVERDLPGRVSIFDLSGTVLARFGGEGDPYASGSLYAPHAVAVDSHGDLYVGEVTHSFSGRGEAGLVPPGCHTFQKFARR